MAYGNLTVPDLPEYDTVTHGNALLVWDYPLGAEDWYMLALYYSGTPFAYDSAAGVVTNPEGISRRRYYSPETGQWTAEQVEQDAPPALSPGRHGEIYQRIWTLRDIRDESGAVWLRADHVTREQCDLRPWLTGLLMGLGLGGGV